MVFNMSEEDWDSVVTVHGRGHFAPTRFACAHWRERAKAGSGTVYGRLIHTTSRSGLYGPTGQANYAFAKGGIAAFSLSVARDMERYGVTSNAVAPVARTRLTEGTYGPLPSEGEFDRWDPGNISPFVAFLCTDTASEITGQVFVVFGGEIQLIEQYQPANSVKKDGRWSVDELQLASAKLFAGRTPGLPDRRPIEGLSPLA
jgi:3-oxoacyl-[acyl-carrier protein] reductase